MEDYYFKEAQTCLRCEKPVCTNCLEAGGGRRSQFIPLWDEKTVNYIIKAYNSGESAMNIARHLNMRPGTLRHQMRRLGILFIGDRPKLTLEKLKEKQNELLQIRPHSQRLV